MIGTIPVNELVSVTPSVLGVGGTAIDLNGLVLTTSSRVPIGSVLSFGSQPAVAAFFGPASKEAAMAAVYFSGYSISNVKPSTMLFAQYALNAVSAYLQGGNISGISLPTLQSYNGTLSIVIDGTTKSGTVNLSGATSFSNAAEVVGQTLGIEGLSAGNYTASLSTTVMTVSAVINGPLRSTFTASLLTTVMTVTNVTNGKISVGDVVIGTGISAGTTIQSFGTGTGGAGTYNLSGAATTESAETINSYSPAGALAVGQVVSGTGITTGTYIQSLGTGTGGVGTYNLSASATTESNETVQAFSPAVLFDSVSGAFIVNSGTTGASSTLAFATGTIAANLLLTQASGAVLSQGSAPNSPSAFMTTLTASNRGWACFTTGFDPDQGVAGNVNKLAFSLWNSQQNNRYAYVPWDTDITPTESVPAVNSLGQQIITNEYSGICPVWEPSDTNLASFVLGYAASLDFTEVDGRTTAAFLTQPGLTPGVTDQTTANNLAGNPQNSGDFGNGYNFYGAYATANASFNFFQRGTISGPFEWLDSYLNQIWLNMSFQNALINLLATAKSIPYTVAGNAMIEASLADIIQQGLAFGVYRSGVTLSASQIADVNAAAGGTNIASTLQNQGWYLLVGTASPTVRQARGSPPCTFFYTDGESVQSINLASIALL
jgi:hypothetical protein